jgi:hypothetical protein
LESRLAVFCSLILGSLIADGGATASEVEDSVVSLKAALARPIPPELFGKGDRTTRRSTVLSFTGNSRKFAYSAKSTSRTYSKATNSEMTSPVVIVRTSEALFSDLKG